MLATEPGDLHLHDVAGTQVRETSRQGDALRRAGEHEVTGVEGQVHNQVESSAGTSTGPSGQKVGHDSPFDH